MEKCKLRQDLLARSTHVSKLVSSFEALTSQPCHAAAGITPVLTLPDADQVLSRRSVRDIKDELEGKASTTSSESAASVSPHRPPKPHLIGDTAGATSDDVEPAAEDLLRSLVLGDAAGNTKVTVMPSRTQSVAGKDAVRPNKPPRIRSATAEYAQRALAVRQEQLLRTLLMGLTDETSQTTITVTPRKPVRRQSLAVKLVEPAPTQHLTDAATEATESTPVLRPHFVLYRNNFGQFGFSLLTTFPPDMERCHLVFQAADSIATLPTGRLVAVDFQSVQDKTAAELHDIVNRSTESVRLRIQQLSLPLEVLQEMVADQVSPVTYTYQEYADYYRQRRAHPARRWVKRKLRGVARALSRFRGAFTSCWR
ncbi:Hypp511 [Branchiostoma lanceolatum]|uniref:Hypp511 protein n=1 Tax=Branchiostoma lanceolatum TaxID=7740 RepID=A0A8J9W0T0_BRALA|nr:Hypp511 [Branchiostoma lanceolatum]